jgi:trans-aconitate 2-methyltransferase
MPWNPDTYAKFATERSAPFYDLLEMVHRRENLRVIDLGCGTGELTRQLADTLPGSDVLGVDNSPEMLTRSATFARPGLRFELADLTAVTGEYDLIFSNAAIQWVEHATLIPRLIAMLRPGGQLAVQLPSNRSHFSHQTIREIAATEPFRSALNGWAGRLALLPLDEYAELLYTSGGENLTVIEKVYPHILENADAVADWTSGTALVPYFERMDEPMRAQFMETYRARLREHWPNSPVFYGFRRTLFTAFKPA